MPCLFLIASAALCFSLATYAVSQSVVGWLLYHAPLLLHAASARCFFPPYYLCHCPLCHWLILASCTTAPQLCFRVQLALPLLPLPFPAPSMVGCCVMHCCSFFSALAYFPLATFAIPHSIASWLLRPVPLLLLLALLPLTSPLLSLPLPALLLVGCYVAHRFSFSLHLRASPLLPLLIPLLCHPLVCPGWLQHHHPLHRFCLLMHLPPSLDTPSPILAHAPHPPPHHHQVDFCRSGLLCSCCCYSTCLKCEGNHGAQTSLLLARMGRGCSGWSQRSESMGMTTNL
jgi:hypothetical protein